MSRSYFADNASDWTLQLTFLGLSIDLDNLVNSFDAREPGRLRGSYKLWVTTYIAESAFDLLTLFNAEMVDVNWHVCVTNY